ncbi:hypothetical protein C791_1428 [Amycolatopsis azurea DSM 43854]|uniref:Uncharacterized protein n=1 Tax=Amycolatopsis azurea DSM 43854 TaxID=1238180 RepID=M2QMT1_9PSEU|nr:hypothetical protein C791_1428 [Amycolatopsis azurea DSM 43854]
MPDFPRSLRLRPPAALPRLPALPCVHLRAGRTPLCVPARRAR